MKSRLVTVFGGSGFIGRYVVEKLAARGEMIRVAVRRPADALFLKPLGDLGQVQVMAANLNNEASIKRAVAGADCAINLVGVLFNDGGQSFQNLHEEGAARAARCAADVGVKTFVHMSALGADQASASEYARTKGRGEEAVLDACPRATIIRPSVVFGPEDGFYNRFAALAAKLPVLPIPGAETRFQPVYVRDVAEAIVRASVGGRDVEGKAFSLGGPQAKTLRELLEEMMAYTGIKRPIINVPFGLAMLQATFLGLLPNPPLTRDQVTLLRQDNVVPDGAEGLAALGITPTRISAVLPTYMIHHKRHGQFKAS
ncbi:complex I NDUFA9 subunit family protein [Kordiimonas aestuarii]|uniref:complex I NDUFA9 subunit family protein n=1 Tax=Kordiimonas aestuarii TaxID=1005925 RepID=UPI0021D34FA9|nr:complex I NDUFA9 subunit family protein [Kordiimonas aestuarii]